MIDTVVLQIDLTKGGVEFAEYSYNKWKPSLIGTLIPPFDGYIGKKTLINNPTEKDKQQWGYLPYLTIRTNNKNGTLRQTMYVQFSAPKLFFGNNFSELSDKDFDALCLRISRRLQLMGVYVSPEFVAQCDVKHIDYCKNIVYTDGTAPSSVIRLMYKSNISGHKNTNVSKYKNGGESCNFYSLVDCFCTYDKCKELKRCNLSKRGRIEEDNVLQANFFNQLELIEPFQVLRLEYRLETKTAIKQNLVKTGIISPNPTFRDLYNSDISKQLLINKMHEIDDNIPIVAKCNLDITSFMESLNVLNPKASLPLKLKALAARAILSETGCRDFRNLIEATDKQWFDLMNDIKKLKMPTKTLINFDEIYKQLEAFIPVKLEDYIDKMSDIDIQ